MMLRAVRFDHGRYQDRFRQNAGRKLRRFRTVTTAMVNWFR